MLLSSQQYSQSFQSLPVLLSPPAFQCPGSSITRRLSARLPPPNARRVPTGGDEWKEQLSQLLPEEARKHAPSRKQQRRQELSEENNTSNEVLEDVFNLDGGWSVEVLGDVDDDDDEDVSMVIGEEEWDSEDEEEELGMAARTLLQTIPRHRLKALESLQADANEVNAAVKVNARRRTEAERKLHTRLRIMGGAQAGKRILSGRGETTRPMMEKVRKALFDMLQAFEGGDPAFLEGTRWLDLFAGTGSVGLEALSRGASHCQFIELDSWVVQKVLGPNIEACGGGGAAVVHTGKAELFLKRARDLPDLVRAPYDYVSVCPPYLEVSYEELFELLKGSPLLHESSVVFVEYPQSAKSIIPGQLCGIPLVRDRKYGRTQLAVYASL